MPEDLQSAIVNQLQQQLDRQRLHYLEDQRRYQAIEKWLTQGGGLTIEGSEQSIAIAKQRWSEVAPCIYQETI